MTDTNPPPSAWEAMQQVRRQMIAEGITKPGEEGAFWRLMEIVDTAKVEQWLKGEHIRGTRPDHLFGVMSQVIASCALLTATVVQRHQLRGAAQDIMRHAESILDNDVQRILKPPAVTMPGEKNVVRMPPRLRRVFGGSPQGPTSNVPQIDPTQECGSVHRPQDTAQQAEAHDQGQEGQSLGRDDATDRE